MNESRSGSCVLYTNRAVRNQNRREGRGGEAVMDDCEERDGWITDTHTGGHARPVTDDYFLALLAPSPR